MTRRRHPLACLALAVLPGGCAAPAGPWAGTIDAYGSLRAMFHEGRTGAAVTLDALLPNDDLYAVGALADLQGEVTVIGGTAYLSYPIGDDAARTEVHERTSAGAALLVTAEVPAWRRVVVERRVPFEALDAAIAGLAASVGLDPGARFPFLVEGELEDLRWHVIDGRRLRGGGRSHEEHLEAAAKLSRARTRAVLVGFHSRSDQGVFTHMGSSTHIHCLVREPLSTGHVDHVTLPAGATVSFPAPAR